MSLSGVPRDEERSTRRALTVEYDIRVVDDEKPAVRYRMQTLYR